MTHSSKGEKNTKLWIAQSLVGHIYPILISQGLESLFWESKKGVKFEGSNDYNIPRLLRYCRAATTRVNSVLTTACTIPMQTHTRLDTIKE